MREQHRTTITVGFVWWLATNTISALVQASLYVLYGGLVIYTGGARRDAAGRPLGPGGFGGLAAVAADVRTSRPSHAFDAHCMAVTAQLTPRPDVHTNSYHL